MTVSTIRKKREKELPRLVFIPCEDQERLDAYAEILADSKGLREEDRALNAMLKKQEDYIKKLNAVKTQKARR